jgi:signal transduction histidine kinase
MRQPRVDGALHEPAEAAVAHLADGVIVTGSAGTISLWNPAAARMTGIAATHAVGRRLAELLPDWPAVERFDASPKTLPAGNHDRPDSWLSVSAARVDGGAVYTLRDVTNERRLERMQSEFIATVSHELRSPLAAVTGAALTLARPEALADKRIRDQLATVIGEESSRLTRLVSDILTVGSLEGGTLRLELAQLDPREPVRSAVERLRRRLPAKHALELRVDEAVQDVVVDRDRLLQVLGNLLENAVKYSPDGGRIRVSVERRPDEVEISVADEGVGIAPGDRNHVFDKFYRAGSRAAGAAGSGLGLYVSRELVRRMRGRLFVQGRPRGSRFVIALPAA